jgi:hypothetical protein
MARLTRLLAPALDALPLPEDIHLTTDIDPVDLL